MAQFIVPLHSKSKNQSVISVLDTDHGFIYFQTELFLSLTPNQQLRDVTVGSKGCVYATTPNSLRIYTYGNSGAYPYFQLKKEITLPEWMLFHDRPYSGLMPIFWSKNKNKLFIGNNSLSSIDEFDEKGKFLSRRFLWEISPSLFNAKRKIKNKTSYGHIRYISESANNELLATIAFRTDGNVNSVIKIDSGESLLDHMPIPHGGLFLESSLYLADARAGQLVHYKFEGKSNSAIKEWASSPRLIGAENSKGELRLRGMSHAGNQIYCSVITQKNTNGQNSTSRIAGFDMQTGRQKSEYLIPNIGQLGSVIAMSLVKLPAASELSLNDFPIFYEDEKKIKLSKINKSNNSINIEQPSASENKEFLPITINLSNISLSYVRSSTTGFNKSFKSRKTRKFWALREISLQIRKGDVVGLIGRNGSGKSTLGLLIAGILKPDKGSIDVFGKAQLLSLGVGFRNELTGRDNIFLAGSLLGLTKKHISDYFDEILEFSELDEFIDEPVRTYSAGMRSRLAFAIATVVDPDILVLDEVLSTGDQPFRKKARKRILQMQSNANTVVIVSHNPRYLSKVCNRVIWLDKGQLILDGKPKTVLSNYERYCKNPEYWMHENLAS